MPRRLPALAAPLAALLLLAAPVYAAPQDVDLLSDDGITTRIDGQAPADQAGRQVAPAGDFNGDGRADVVIGAPDTDNNDRTDSGSVYVVYGAAGTDAADVDLASTDPAVLARYMRIDGVGAGDRLGRAVAGAGDFNGDGRADVVVGAPEADPLGRTDIGAAYVVYGATGDSADVDLGTSDAARFLTIAGAGSATGGAVAGPGSVNADPRADVIVGASGADPFGRTNAGIAHVVYGETTADPADVDLLAGDATRFATVYGAEPSDQLGTSVGAAGAHNADTKPDVVLGAISVDGATARNAGAAYVVYGETEQPDLPDLDLAHVPSMPRYRTLRGAAADDQLGNSVGGGTDFNGDGRDDVIAGAQLADVGNRVNAGSATVLYGAATADPPDVSLASGDPTVTARYMSIFGAAADDRAGFAVAAAGRFGEDALPGVVVGAIQADANGRIDSGSAFVVHGQTQADPGDIDLATTEESTLLRLVRIDGAAAGDQAGRSVASAGDHNGDGSAEVIVDALRADNNGRTDSGSAYVVAYDADDDGAADASQDVDSDGTRDRDDNCVDAANASQSDTDGDGQGDACDPDADADGTANADDDFPLNAAEDTDTDGDGQGDAADTDDDGDGTPDADDGFPLDPSTNGRTTTTVTTTTPGPATTTPGPATTTPGPTVTVRVPAAPLRLWRLERSARPSVGATSVDSGFVAVCPAGGPDCAGRVTLKAFRTARRGGRVVKVFLHGKVPVLRIAAGTERRLTFRLSARGRRTLRSLTTVTTELRGSIRTGDAEPAVRTAEIVLTR